MNSCLRDIYAGVWTREYDSEVTTESRITLCVFCVCVHDVILNYSLKHRVLLLK